MTGPRRVLIVHPYGIGDLLFVTPVLRALRLDPRVERVDLLLGSRTESVVRENPHVDTVIALDKDRLKTLRRVKRLRELTALAISIRKAGYDLMLDYSLRSEYGFWGKTVWDIPLRAAFDYRGRARFHNRRLPLPGGFSARHVCDWYCDLAEAAGVPVRDRWLEFYLSDADRDEAAAAIPAGVKRYAVCAPGGGESWGRDAGMKRWNPEFFAVLLKRLSDELSLDAVAVLGSASESVLAVPLETAGLRVMNLAGKIGIRAAAAVIDRAVFFAGNDGGLLHVAGARRKPLFGLYGPADPGVYGPFPATPQAVALAKHGLSCRPCYQKFRYPACLHRTCLERFTPDEAFDDLEKAGFLKACSSGHSLSPHST